VVASGGRGEAGCGVAGSLGVDEDDGMERSLSLEILCRTGGAAEGDDEPQMASYERVHGSRYLGRAPASDPASDPAPRSVHDHSHEKALGAGLGAGLGAALGAALGAGLGAGHKPSLEPTPPQTPPSPPLAPPLSLSSLGSPHQMPPASWVLLPQAATR